LEDLQMIETRWIAAAVLALALLPGAARAGAKAAEITVRAAPGTPFADGDRLVARALGLVDWYRGGRLLATLGDPAGLVAAGREGETAGRLALVDALGRPVSEVSEVSEARAGQALFLALGPPARIFYQRGHRLPAGVLMTYHGGYVMGASRTVAIFWGPEWGDPAFAGDKVAGIDGLLSGFTGSGYIGVLKEYATKASRATSATTYLGHVFDASPPPAHNLSPLEVLNEACKVTSGQPDPATVYLVYTSTGLDPVKFCAYHTWWQCDSGAPLQAAYLPNLDGVKGCDIKDTVTAHSPGLAALANGTAHELAEAITDPRGEGWFDALPDFGGEIGDKCAYVFGRRPVTLADGAQWKLQTLWSNAAYRTGKGLLNRQRQAGCVAR
jgi:hypothetical protein